MKLIPKYQNAGLVTRQDNTYVAKPTIPPKLIKRTYTPTQSYVSQDNRSGWQREQGSKKADEEYKKYVEDKKIQQGLENLNGFLNFVDAATIATGIGSVVGKGASYVGRQTARRLAKRAIAKEFERQSNHLTVPTRITHNTPKIIQAPVTTHNERTMLFNTGRQSKISRMEADGIPKGERNQPIKSKLDWRNWSKGGPISKKHLAEYNQIEKEARYDGSWLMTSDGRSWEGDPRTWVQLMSKDGNKFKKGKYPSNSDLYYHGIGSERYLEPERMQEMYLANDFNRARTYTNTSQPASPETKGGILHLGIPNNIKPLEINAQGASWHKIISPFTGKQSSTDIIKNQAYAKGYDAVAFDNVLDNGANWASGVNPFEPTREIVINNIVPRKSLIWNNGDFNINDPNIYKATLPLLTGGMSYEYNR